MTLVEARSSSDQEAALRLSRPLAHPGLPWPLRLGAKALHTQSPAAFLDIPSHLRELVELENKAANKRTFSPGAMAPFRRHLKKLPFPIRPLLLCRAIPQLSRVPAGHSGVSHHRPPKNL